MGRRCQSVAHAAKCVSHAFHSLLSAGACIIVQPALQLASAEELGRSPEGIAVQEELDQ